MPPLSAFGVACKLARLVNRHQGCTRVGDFLSAPATVSRDDVDHAGPAGSRAQVEPGLRKQRARHLELVNVDADVGRGFRISERTVWSRDAVVSHITF